MRRRCIWPQSSILLFLFVSFLVYMLYYICLLSIELYLVVLCTLFSFSPPASWVATFLELAWVAFVLLNTL